MKIPLSLKFPEPALQKRFTNRLVALQKPFRMIIVIICPFAVTMMTMGLIWNRRGEDISSYVRDVNLIVNYSLCTIMGLIAIQRPKWTTNLFMLTRFILSILLIYSQYKYLLCREDVS